MPLPLILASCAFACVGKMDTGIRRYDGKNAGKLYRRESGDVRRLAASRAAFSMFPYPMSSAIGTPVTIAE